MLFNEPKLLKFTAFSACWRVVRVSVLFNEPKLLKCHERDNHTELERVSVLFNEPKLLKFASSATTSAPPASFSALQRAEIAEIRLFRRSTAET